MSQRNTTVLLCLSVLLLAVSAEGESRVLSSIPEVMIPSVESNICLKKSTDPAGFDYDALSISERTQRFIDGPCSPLILVPGVEGSRLQVNIDCETLKSESPDVFKDCGWNSCDSSSWEPWKIVPDSQYDIWVPDPLTPMDILANVVFPKCWGGLFTLSYDASEPEFSQRLKNPPGVTVQWYKQGSDEQECGLDAISTLLPAEWLSELNGEFSYFQNMITSLKSLGYITGVSLFATPYDWRRSPESDETHYSITGTADLIHSLTGKKAVLLSHSLGNMQVLYTLNHMTQEAKDSTIAHYVAVMPPYIGAAKAADNLVGTNDFDPFYAGINTPSLKQVSGTSTSLYDIIPKATYQTQANEPYMQDLMTRLNAEKKFDPSTPQGIAWWNENASSLPYQWFPTPNEDCSNGNMEEREDVHCIMGIRNWAEQIFLQIEDQAFVAVQEDLDEFVTSGVAVFMPEERTELYDGVMKNEIGEIINPNVEVTTIYGASLNTINNVYYDYDPAKTVREGKNTTPTSIGYELGDGTVPVSSALLGSLKWGWEYEHGTNADAKPIHLLEWCSSYDKGTLSFNQQESSYSGLWCKCLASSQDGSKCDHMKSVTDPNMINWVGHFLTNLDNPVDNSASPSGLTMSDSELTTLATTCPTLNNLPNNPDKRPSSNVEVGNASDYFLH